MKYQRARLVDGQHPDLGGAVVWVEAAPPEDRIALRNQYKENDFHKVTITDDLQMTSSYVSNVRSFNEAGTARHDTFLIPSDWVELLNEFADDVPIVTWDEWLAENSKDNRILN